MRNFIELNDLCRLELENVLDRADALREAWKANRMPQSLRGRKLALWFWGQGFRNRVAFEIGARSMGADVSFIPGDLGVHEPIEDIGRYLGNWFSMLVIRCRSHADLERVARDSKVPVINARTTYNHPCEIVGDLQYVRRERKSLEGLHVAFVGEVTNLCRSWLEAALVLPIEVTQVAPEKYLLPRKEVERLNTKAAGRIATSTDLEGSIRGDTDVLYTDCWPKEGDEAAIREAFLPYQITRCVVDRIGPHGFFLPCPPVSRGKEVSEDAMTSDRCLDYEAKEYLLHAQNALMEFSIGAI